MIKQFRGSKSTAQPAAEQTAVVSAKLASRMAGWGNSATNRNAATFLPAANMNSKQDLDLATQGAEYNRPFGRVNGQVSKKAFAASTAKSGASKQAQLVPPALQLQQLGFSYSGAATLDRISLEIQAGEIFCLVGPSGSGKSTLLRLIAGLEQPTTGTVLIAGSEIANCRSSLAPAKRGVSLVFQDYALFPHLTARENIALAVANLSRNEQTIAITEALEMIEMADHADLPCQLLSGGQQQRVALARALVLNPRLMLFDEAFSNLDATMRNSIRDNTLSIIKRCGITALLVTHDVGEVLPLADRLAVLDQGRIVQQGSPDQVYTAPLSAKVAELLGHCNICNFPIASGMVVTPFGELPLPENCIGATKVCCVIREEIIKLGRESIPSPLLSTASVKLTSVRHLGVNSWIRCQLPSESAPSGHWPVKARIPRRDELRIGKWYRLELDPAQLLLYPH